MNAAEFGTELGKLTERAVADGVVQRKMTFQEMIGILELQKLEVARHMQDLARLQMAQKNKLRIIPASGPLPPIPGGQFQ